MAVTEKKIRDKLVGKLHLLEQGLVALESEGHLPNIDGASGFVDILARDLLGNVVLIELKRSDAAARQAIHELFKYVSLIRQVHGLPETRLRCFVVSTHWHELRTPFSEFARAVSFPTTSFLLSVAPDGEPIAASPVTLVAEKSELQLCPLQWLACCENPEQRDLVEKSIVSFLTDAGIEDFLLLSVDAGLARPGVAHGFVSCIVLGHVAPVLRRNLLSKNIHEVADYDGAEFPEWSVEEALLSRIHRVGGYASAEFGDPQKLLGMVNDGWMIRRIQRGGRLSSKTIYPDDAIVDLATAMAGGNAIAYYALTRPSFSLQWQKMLTDIEYPLMGNEVWSRGLPWYLRQVEAFSAEAAATTVAIHIYNPMDALGHLVKGLSDADERYFPAIEVVVSDLEHRTMRVLRGQWSWTGCEPQPIEQIVNEVFDGCFEIYGFRRVVHELWVLNDEVCRRLGLTYSLVEWTYAKGEAPRWRSVCLQGIEPGWAEASGPDRSFLEFQRSHRASLSLLVKYFWARTFEVR